MKKCVEKIYNLICPSRLKSLPELKANAFSIMDGQANETPIGIHYAITGLINEQSWEKHNLWIWTGQTAGILDQKGDHKYTSSDPRLLDSYNILIKNWNEYTHIYNSRCCLCRMFSNRRKHWEEFIKEKYP